VQRIVNGQMLKKPLLQVTVDGKDERGMLGITASKNESRNVTYVFLFYTEFKPTYHSTGITLGNRLYRYELMDDSLVNPKLILDLPTKPGPSHNGGKIKIGPDGDLYLTIGDIDGSLNGSNFETKAQNYEDGSDPDGRAGILRIDQDGKPVGEGVIGTKFPTNLYYAYGIKNSFGIDFDPIAGNLWDSENGPTYGDEINLVRPGFNSGWSKIQGMWTVNDKTARISWPAPENPQNLVDFDGKGQYSPPEFTWKPTVAPTAIIFLKSDKLGDEYRNQLFVGDIKFGNIYHF
jgi:glucose/arabinose dehydrogenase